MILDDMPGATGDTTGGGGIPAEPATGETGTQTPTPAWTPPPAAPGATVPPATGGMGDPMAPATPMPGAPTEPPVPGAV